MIWAIDIGNTHTDIGAFAGDQLVHHWKLRSDPARTTDEWGLLLTQLCAETPRPSRILICSVAPAVTPKLETALRRYITEAIQIVTYQSDFGLINEYETPETLGMDRLVGAFAAVELFRRDCLVIDAGTATTMDAITADRRYLGGVILPGFRLAARALLSGTAQLFSVDLTEAPKQVMGRSTRACLQSGILYGAAAQMDGLIERMAAEWGVRPWVIATGGEAELLQRLSPKIDAVEPHLILKGLNLWATRN